MPLRTHLLVVARWSGCSNTVPRNGGDGDDGAAGKISNQSTIIMITTFLRAPSSSFEPQNGEHAEEQHHFPYSSLLPWPTTNQPPPLILFLPPFFAPTLLSLEVVLRVSQPAMEERMGVLRSRGGEEAEASLTVAHEAHGTSNHLCRPTKKHRSSRFRRPSRRGPSPFSPCATRGIQKETERRRLAWACMATKMMSSPMKEARE